MFLWRNKKYISTHNICFCGEIRNISVLTCFCGEIRNISVLTTYVFEEK